jgi:hypothetical protein
MRLPLLIALCGWCPAVTAQSYFLEPISSCTTHGGEKLAFECRPVVNKYKMFLQYEKGRWVLKHVWDNPRLVNSYVLDLVRDDENILVLSQPVYFSGSRLLHFIKSKNEFFESEVAFASFGSEATIDYGRFSKGSP